ncbi:MAG: hypothetical protein WBP94_17000 [Rhodomicrobiaceae bacterium]
MRAHNGVLAGRSRHQMEVVVEPIRRAVERIAATHGDVTTKFDMPAVSAQACF